MAMSFVWVIGLIVLIALAFMSDSIGQFGMGAVLFVGAAIVITFGFGMTIPFLTGDPLQALGLALWAPVVGVVAAFGIVYWQMK